MNNELLKLFDIKDDVVETFTVDHKESNYEIDIRFKPSRFSCPTCGRTRIDLIGLAEKVEKMVSKYDNLDIKVAVMGCVVNGPGEAREADIGVAGGVGEGLLIKKGEIVKKVPEDMLLQTLEDELKNWSE